MKSEQFRKIIREEVVQVLKEDQMAQMIQHVATDIFKKYCGSDVQNQTAAIADISKIIKTGLRIQI
jgi:hypothetical protein